jgi:myo-inositol-1(or 4)-monophosphatase
MHPIINIATSAARKAGTTMVQAINRLDTLKTNQKGLNDFVTEIDHKAEKQIIEIIKKAYPDHQIIAEESGSHAGRDDCVWIIDPLDGTYNFLRGIPHFCISIGFQFKGKIQHGLIYDPLIQELFVASKGDGARLNDRRIRVSNTTKLEQALIAVGFPTRTPDQLSGYQGMFNNLLPQVCNVRCTGSAALNLAYVAANRFDGYVQKNLHPWDMAAGILMIKEAGGSVADWNGEENYLENGHIVSGTPKIFSLLMQCVAKANLVPS